MARRRQDDSIFNGDPLLTAVANATSPKPSSLGGPHAANPETYGNMGTPMSPLGAPPDPYNPVYYVPGTSGSVTVDPATGQQVPEPIPASGTAQQIAMALAQLQANRPGGGMTPSSSAGGLENLLYNIMPNPQGVAGATSIQDIVDQAGTGYGSLAAFGPTAAPQVSPFGSSGLGVNESVLNANIWDNPQMALLLSGFVDPGTPGYNNLANLGFDPLAVYYASGGSPTQTTGTDYAQWLANMYTTLGTRADQGGGSITAGPLLQNLVNMPKGSELWKMMKDDPTVFYTMASSVMEAGGASPMAQSAFKSQIAQLYSEYLAYTATVTKAGDTLVISDWIRSHHPEVVASWGG